MANSGLFDLYISSRRAKKPPTILVGVTHAQTCLVLGARLRALRNAGFHVLLLSSPGPLLDITAAREQVERIELPMRRLSRIWCLSTAFGG
jgi:hypothetical protein